MQIAAEDTRVRSVMNSQLVTVPPEATVRELVRILADEEISGAPVVGGDGRVVGVVSATDVVRFAADEVEAEPDQARWSAPAPRDEADIDGCGAAAFFLEPEVWNAGAGPDVVTLSETAFDEYTVRDVMTPVAFAVKPDDTLSTLVHCLLRRRIHRALVIEDARLLGIVTPFDVLRALYGDPPDPLSA